MKQKSLSPGISVVVCCYNSAEVIVPTLKALAAQSPPAGYEVILVDNRCVDDTVRLARQAWRNAGGDADSLRVATEETPGLIHARRRGVDEARHDILLFMDDDNLVPAGGIAALWELYRLQPDAAGMGGRVEPLFQGTEPAWFPLAAGTFACTPSGPGAGLPASRTTMSGAGFSFRTRHLISLFRSPVPLFLIGRREGELSRGEDAEICLRVALQGGELRYEPGFRIQHFLKSERLNWEHVLSARRWYGRADVVLGMYKDVLAGQEPPSYPERLERVDGKWRALQSRLADTEEGTREGSRLALKRSLLLGLRQGLEEMGRQRFEEIRAAIRSLAPGGRP